MAENEPQMPTAVQMLTHLAELVTGGLSCPLSIDLQRAPRYRSPGVEMRMDDDDTAGVDAWARHLGATAEAGEPFVEPPPVWRSYGFYARLAGWRVRVWVRWNQPTEEAGS